MPLLARIYLPENFGTLANFTSIVAISSCFVTLRYEQALFLTKDEPERKTVLNLSLALLAVFTCLIFFASWLMYKLTNYFIELDLKWFFVPIGCFFFGLNQVLTALQTKRGNFFNISSSKVAQSTIAVATQFLLKGMNSLGLVLGYMAGSILGLFPLLKGSKMRMSKFTHNDYSSLKKVAKRYSNFPKYQTLSAMLNGISGTIPIFLLTTLYSPEITGLYSFSHRLLLVPVTFIGQSVRQVFIQRASENLEHLDKLTRFYFSTTKILTVAGIFSFSLFFLFSDQIVLYFFGKDWTMSSEYISLLCFWIFFLFINPPSVACLTLLEKQKFNMFYDLFLIVSRIGAIFLGYYMFNDPLKSILFFSIVGVVFNIFLISYVSSLLKGKNAH